MKICFTLLSFFYTYQIYATQTIYIATAANFTKTLQKIAVLFEKQNKDIKIKITSGSSGVLANQIMSNAPFDIFFSADEKYIEFLKRNKKTEKGTDFSFATGKLVLAIPNKNIKNTDETTIKQILLSLKGPVALAAPNLAPFGLAGQEVLNHLYSKLEQQNILKIYGRNIEQTFYYVYSGSAAAAFVSLSNVLEEDNYTENYWLIPQKYYTPIAQMAVIISDSKNSTLAKNFVSFFRNSTEVKTILMQAGYG